MGLEKIAVGAGKVAKSVGRFLYETGRGFAKGVGKAVYETGKGAYRGITGIPDSPSNDDILEGFDPSNFLKDLRMANLPKKNYNDIASLVSRKSSNYLSDSDRIEKSLNLLDRMYEESYINMRTHKKLKKFLYNEFKGVLRGRNNYNPNNLFDYSAKRYLPLAASFLFLLSGAFLLSANLTGFSVLGSIPRSNLDPVGVISFVFSLSFLLYFLRINEGK